MEDNENINIRILLCIFLCLSYAQFCKVKIEMFFKFEALYAIIE